MSEQQIDKIRERFDLKLSKDGMDEMGQEWIDIHLMILEYDLRGHVITHLEAERDKLTEQMAKAKTYIEAIFDDEEGFVSQDGLDTLLNLLAP